MHRYTARSISNNNNKKKQLKVLFCTVMWLYTCYVLYTLHNESTRGADALVHYSVMLSFGVKRLYAYLVVINLEDFTHVADFRYDYVYN